jgi:anti-sigma factor RsiW
MTNDPVYQHLLELSWRRKLTLAQEAQLRAWLAAHPDGQADLEAEVGLNDILDRLPQAPVPSNFTARVLAAVARDARTAERSSILQRGWRWRLRWLSRAALASGIACVVMISCQHIRSANAMELFKGVALMPDPDVVMNFDTIRALNRTPAADEELLKIFQ